MCAEGMKGCLSAHTTVFRWQFSDFPNLCAHVGLYEAFECVADGCVKLGYEGGNLSGRGGSHQKTIIHTVAKCINSVLASCLYSIAHIDCVIS